MENITELRKICQTTAKQDRSNLYMLHVSRFISIYFTRLLLPTPVTPNQISFAMIMTGIASSLFFLCPHSGVYFLGAILLQAWYILDCMDGEVARYRHYQTTGSIVIHKQQSSMAGSYYDAINHYIVNLLVPSSIGYGLFLKTQNSMFVLLGIVGALGQVLMLAMHDAKSRFFLSRISKYRQTTVKSAQDHGAKSRHQFNLVRTVFSILHYVMTYPTIMNLVLLSALLNFFIPSIEWRTPLILFITFGSALVSITIITRNISCQHIDHEFSQKFDVVD